MEYGSDSMAIESLASEILEETVSVHPGGVYVIGLAAKFRQDGGQAHLDLLQLRTGTRIFVFKV